MRYFLLELKWPGSTATAWVLSGAEFLLPSILRGRLETVLPIPNEI